MNKFAFTKFGNRYVLIVKNVLFADAGIYKCSNVMQASLTVVAPPICAPRVLAPVEENHDLSVSCVVNFAGAPPGEDTVTEERDLVVGELASAESIIGHK